MGRSSKHEDKGRIRIQGLGTFAYMKWNSSTPDTFVFMDVRFARWVNTTVIYTGGSCFPNGAPYGGYIITFQDGSSENLITCLVGPDQPTEIRFTKHTNPQAGLIISPTGAFYFLVRFYGLA